MLPLRFHEFLRIRNFCICFEIGFAETPTSALDFCSQNQVGKCTRKTKDARKNLKSKQSQENLTLDGKSIKVLYLCRQKDGGWNQITKKFSWSGEKRRRKSIHGHFEKKQ